MATNREVLEHLGQLRNSVNYAINTVADWQKFGAMMTAGSKTTELAQITTVPTERQHASNCAICTAWDGSVRA